jgi:hypothetical protein
MPIPGRISEKLSCRGNNFVSNNAVFTGNLQNTGGTLYAQTLTGNAATLTINGNYSQGAGGTLVATDSSLGCSVVTINAVGGLGGTAQLNGTLLLSIDAANPPGATPPAGIAFLNYVNRVGDFASIQQPANGWWVNQAGGPVWHTFANPVPNLPAATPNANGKEYDLFVQ